MEILPQPKLVMETIASLLTEVEDVSTRLISVVKDQSDLSDHVLDIVDGIVKWQDTEMARQADEKAMQLRRLVLGEVANAFEKWIWKTRLNRPAWDSVTFAQILSALKRGGTSILSEPDRVVAAEIIDELRSAGMEDEDLGNLLVKLKTGRLEYGGLPVEAKMASRSTLIEYARAELEEGGGLLKTANALIEFMALKSPTLS